ncbi:MAG: LysR family transcriptional regulator, partial [Gammaproteobacteria bacterium]|nr:LysR family transcriptional regulator [Gammaproteobacteria bacterium]
TETLDGESTSKVAERLSITQSALSDSISDLEQQVGVALFHRRKARGVVLTGAGEAILSHARELLRQSEIFEFETARISQRAHGELRLGCYNLLVHSLMPMVYQAVDRHLPTLGIDLWEDHLANLQSRIRDSRLEAAFVYGVGFPEDFEYWPMGEIEPFIVLAADHPLAQMERVDLNALADEPFLMMDVSPSALNTESIFAEIGLKPKVDIRTRNLELIRSLVAARRGYSLLMLSAHQRTTSIEGKPIAVLPLANKVTVQSYGLMYLKQHRDTGKIALFRDMLGLHVVDALREQQQAFIDAF